MNIDVILNKIIRTLRVTRPETLFLGQLIKENRVFNPATLENVSDGRPIVKDVEIIFDSITTEDVGSSVIKDTAVKLIIIASAVKDIDFYDLIRINANDYTISKKIDIVVGSDVALFTVIANIG